MAIQFIIPSKTSSSSRVAELLVEVIPLVIREMRNDFRTYRLMNEKAVTVLQFRVLANLYIESLNNKNLAELVGISVPAMSRLVKKLVNKGLVERVQGSKDKREVRVDLTSKGVALYKRGTAIMGKQLNHRMMTTTPANLQQAESGLRVLKNLFSDMNSSHASSRKVL